MASVWKVTDISITEWTPFRVDPLDCFIEVRRVKWNAKRKDFQVRTRQYNVGRARADMVINTMQDMDADRKSDMVIIKRKFECGRHISPNDFDEYWDDIKA